MARTMTDLSAELQALLAEDGAANDFWTQTDLESYVMKGIRMVSAYGRPNMVKGLVDEGSISSLSPVAIDEGEFEHGDLPSDYLRLSEPKQITIVVGINQYIAEYVQGGFAQIKLLGFNGIDESPGNYFIWISGAEIFCTGTIDSIKIQYVGVHSVITASAPSLLDDEGDDYAVQYAHGLALMKGNFNLSAGSELQQLAIKGCR